MIDKNKKLFIQEILNDGIFEFIMDIYEFSITEKKFINSLYINSLSVNFDIEIFNFDIFIQIEPNYLGSRGIEIFFDYKSDIDFNIEIH